jgi:hypothetical protein
MPRMIERGALPPVHRMALLAGGGQVRRAMIHRASPFIVGPMTGIASRIKTFEDAGGCAAVAGFASCHCVCTHQREPVLMLPHRLYRHSPAFYRVAVLAITTELPPVYVGMTCRALASYVREDFTYMAQTALHFFMHPPQREL